jgi:hypothetical protein
MVNQAVEPAAKASYLDMSDADMVNAAVPDELVVAEASEEVTTAPEVVAEAPEVAETETTSPEVVGSAATDEDAGTVAEEGGEEPAVKIDKDLVTTSKSPEPVTDKPVEKDATPSINFEAEYNRLLTPFKANGREITVNSVDDAISLMQMGANYNKKMAGLKPNLKLMKLLENNGLLSEEKIGWLIDLDRKSPDAINKLVKDSGLNPMDLDVDKASEYRPKIHTVDEREIELDTVLDDLQGSPAYSRTLNIVSKEWDGASKQVIAGQPQLLKVINSHIETGIYDQISTEVEQQRVFGRLNGLSDIEAYRQVGDAIQARGGFNHVGKSQGQTTAAPVVVQPKPKKVEDDKLNDKRRAASSTKPVVPTTVDRDFNPLSLSDADFNKLSADKFR